MCMVLLGHPAKLGILAANLTFVDGVPLAPCDTLVKSSTHFATLTYSV